MLATPSSSIKQDSIGSYVRWSQVVSKRRLTGAATMTAHNMSIKMPKKEVSAP